MNRRRFLAAVGATVPLAFCAGCSGTGGDGGQDQHDPTKTIRVQAKLVTKCDGDRKFVSAALSPDGKRIVAGGSDCVLRFYDAADGRLVHKVQAVEPAKEEGGSAWARYTPDGQQLVVTVYIPKVGYQTHFRDAESGKEVKNPYPIPINPWMVFSPDGSRGSLASGGVQVWDLKTGRKLHQFRYAEGHDYSPAGGAAFSPDGRLLAAGIGPGTRRGMPDPDPPLQPALRVWDLETGKEVFRGWDSPGARAADVVAFSPDGKLLAAGGQKGRPMQVWDVGSWKLRHTIQAHTRALHCLAFHPDSRLLASGGSDGPTIKIWDVATGELAATLEGHTKTVKDLSFYPDGKTLVSAEYDNQILIWRIEQK